MEQKTFRHNPAIIKMNFVIIAIALVLSYSEYQAGKITPMIGIAILVVFWAYTTFWESRTPYIIINDESITINNFFFVRSKKIMLSDIEKIDSPDNARFIIIKNDSKKTLIDISKMAKQQRDDFRSAIREMSF